MNQEIENLIRQILDKTKISYSDIEYKESGAINSPRYIIRSEETSLLIGNKGETLRSIHYLLKKLLEKKYPESNFNFIIDSGDYQEKKIQDIKNKAVILGERARFFKKDIEMPLMSSYERMIVHTVLENHRDITTESTGYGKNRRVVIKYLEEF